MKNTKNANYKLPSVLLTVSLIIVIILAIYSTKTLVDYQKNHKNLMPKVLIQEAEFSKSQIAYFANSSEDKNVWLIKDDKDYKKTIELLRESADIISYANQIGRLDLVSIFLAIIGVLFGIFGVVGFLYIREMVSVKAEASIKEYLKDEGIAVIKQEVCVNTKQQLDDYLEGNGKKLIEQAVAKNLEKAIKTQDSEEFT